MHRQSRAGASNVDLSTVPKRDYVQLTIYNSEDLTLVRETRTVTFKKGVNPLQFSWANTLIDPTSVELKFLTQRREAGCAGHHLPARQAADALLECAERFRRRSDDRDHLLHQRHHLEGGLPGIADQDETQMGLEGFVRVYNNSGEEYENAAGPAGGRHHQPGGEDRPAGPHLRWRKSGSCEAETQS